MTNLHRNQKHQRGFTLVEIMVVVAIIGILAAIGLPKMTEFIQTSKTTEAQRQFGKIGEGLTGYVSSHTDAIATLATIINAKNVLSTVAADSTMSKLIPTLQLDSQANFKYTISAAVVGTDIEWCGKAEWTPTDDSTGDIVLWSSRAVPASATSFDWNNNVNTTNFVTGTETPTAGGCCAADGTFTGGTGCT